MDNRNIAFFTERPRRYLDLFLPHFLSKEQEFIIAKRIYLSDIDYENFISDMLVEREYIENAAVCTAGSDGAYRCIFIGTRTSSRGVLVVPDSEGRVIKAAFFEDKRSPYANIFDDLLRLYYRQNIPIYDKGKARIDKLQLF